MITDENEQKETVLNAGTIRSGIERDITEYIRLKLAEFYQQTGLHAYGVDLPAEGRPTVAKLLIK